MTGGVVVVVMRESFPVRVGANAVVVEDGRLLAVRFDDETGVHYNLPGGGVGADERVREALRREVREETTAGVEVGELLFVHEYYPGGDEQYGPVHKLTLFFDCGLLPASTPTLPAEPDPNQVGVEWLPLETVGEVPLLPDLGEEWHTAVDPVGGQRYLTG